MRSKFFFFIVFIYILGWRFGGIGAFDASLLLSILLFALMPSSSFKLLPYKWFFLFSTLSFLLLSMYIGLSSQGSDFSVFPRAVRVPISIVSGITLSLILRANGISSTRVLYWIAIVITINASIAMAMSFSEGFRNVVYSITGALKILNSTSTINSGIRAPGLTYGLSQTSVMQSLGVLVSSLLYFTANQLTKIEKTFCLSMILVNILGCLFIGRTGIVLSLLFLVLISLRGSKNFVIFSLVVISMSPLFYFLDGIEDIKVQMERVDEVLAVFTSGDSHTLDVLSRMYHLPPGLEIIWGGNGMGRTDYFYTSSDVGYVRIIYAAGILGLLIYIAHLVYMSLVVFSMKANHLNQETKYCLVIIILLFFCYSFKELFFYSRNIWQITCLLFGLFICNAKLSNHDE